MQDTNTSKDLLLVVKKKFLAGIYLDELAT